MREHGCPVVFQRKPKQTGRIQPHGRLDKIPEHQHIPLRGVAFHADQHEQAVILQSRTHHAGRAHGFVIRDAHSVQPRATRIAENFPDIHDAAFRHCGMDMQIDDHKFFSLQGSWLPEEAHLASIWIHDPSQFET
nr:hypothetical protein [Pseudodesulfovibrio tunisiensis]